MVLAFFALKTTSQDPQIDKTQSTNPARTEIHSIIAMLCVFAVQTCDGSVSLCLCGSSLRRRPHSDHLVTHHGLDPPTAADPCKDDGACIRELKLEPFPLADQQETREAVEKGKMAHDDDRPPINLENLRHRRWVVMGVESGHLPYMRRMDTEATTEDLGRLPRPELARVNDPLGPIITPEEPTRDAFGVLTTGNRQRPFRVFESTGRFSVADKNDLEL